MDNLFVTHKQAIELKELGFNEPCFLGFDKDGDKPSVMSPMYQQVLNWAYWQHSIFVEISFLENKLVYCNLQYTKNYTSIKFFKTMYPLYLHEAVDCLIKYLKEKNDKD